MIWVARHGETTWNLVGRYQGRLESPLSPLGERQGAALAAEFDARRQRNEPVPERIVSSPLVRCTATAQFVAERLGLEIERDERLIEIAHGTWEGRYRDELAANDPVRYRTWREDPAHVAFENGESLVDVLARWETVAVDLARETRPTLVVTHDAVVRCALLTAWQRSLDDFWQMPVENAAFATLEGDGERLHVVEACHAAHLAGLRASLEGQAL